MNEEAAGNGSPSEEDQQTRRGMPDLPELFITPFGASIDKVNTPDEGMIVLQKILTPGMVYTIKWTEEQAREIAASFGSGIMVARPGDIANLKGST